MPQRDALAELDRCAGTQFDPEVVKALAEELRIAAEPDGVLAR
jgi:HD-GYP domain-containing protein (c-di-GMP phosphodiesterase class II)